MSYVNFVKIYNEDMKHRLREHTYIQKQYMINKKLLPFFGKMPVSQITPAHVRKWQNKLIAYRTKDDKTNSKTYIRTINNQLAAIMDYTIKYYNLRDNPCRKAGYIEKDHADEMQFWTTDELKKFFLKISNKPELRAGFLTLYYTGLRIRELPALEYADIYLKDCCLTVNKSYQRLGDMDVQSFNTI
ncbi:site-specific integrase [Enterocloster bolteae]|uniref:site-specific integrase n=1 Tax=Enterocloster bolteae TaxID=208479 RepID=UPI00210D48C6|nr:site-specific integrase [Enterocloster bolteae]MCQ5142640.1 site-specific integrase [Enterocloster bolteae]